MELNSYIGRISLYIYEISFFRMKNAVSSPLTNLYFLNIFGLSN